MLSPFTFNMIINMFELKYAIFLLVFYLLFPFPSSLRLTELFLIIHFISIIHFFIPVFAFALKAFVSVKWMSFHIVSSHSLPTHTLLIFSLVLLLKNSLLLWPSALGAFPSPELWSSPHCATKGAGSSSSLVYTAFAYVCSLNKVHDLSRLTVGQKLRFIFNW